MQNFGVIGSPISHSLSPLIHNFLFSYFGIDADYQKFLASEMELPKILSLLAGANITVPFKEAVFHLCDEVSDLACQIGAVNTVMHIDGKLWGHNTDGLGFWKCIENLDAKNALILGAGGSARAIAVMLRSHGVDVEIYNRSLSCMDFFRSMGIEVAKLEEEKKFDLLIHTTSVGLDGHSLPYGVDILKNFLARSEIVMDIIYPSLSCIKNIEDFRAFLTTRPKTAFLGLANQGMDGLEMLLYQALFAFEIFCGGRYGFDELKALFYNA
ncbi:shikimate dehydrogenase [Helicobacter pametensis]|uniref:shikimate dehydrogenase n=1 Tax=Helicobacter pametensis TaxID=95149 RepID=UPI0004BC3F9D|nr:shikimate dehydrogenase [Helicobacter pametensis]